MYILNNIPCETQLFLAPKVEDKEEGNIYKEIESKDVTEILEKKGVEA